MGESKRPLDVSLIISILFSKSDILPVSVNNLVEAFGNGELLRYEGRFDFSDYYNEELGIPIKRRFWRADNLFPEIALQMSRLRQTR